MTLGVVRLFTRPMPDSSVPRQRLAKLQIRGLARPASTHSLLTGLQSLYCMQRLCMMLRSSVGRLWWGEGFYPWMHVQALPRVDYERKDFQGLLVVDSLLDS